MSLEDLPQEQHENFCSVKAIRVQSWIRYSKGHEK